MRTFKSTYGHNNVFLPPLANLKWLFEPLKRFLVLTFKVLECNCTVWSSPRVMCSTLVLLSVLLHQNTKNQFMCQFWQIGVFSGTICFSTCFWQAFSTNIVLFHSVQRLPEDVNRCHEFNWKTNSSMSIGAHSRAHMGTLVYFCHHLQT